MLYLTKYQKTKRTPRNCKSDLSSCTKPYSVHSLYQGIADEWGMGMNGDQFLPIHPLEDEWVTIDPHSSPFPIHLLYPVILSNV